MPSGHYIRTTQRPVPTWWSEEAARLEDAEDVDEGMAVWAGSKIPVAPLAPVELRAARVHLAQEMLKLIVLDLGETAPEALREALAQAKAALRALMTVCVLGEEPHSNGTA